MWKKTAPVKKEKKIKKNKNEHAKNYVLSIFKKTFIKYICIYVYI